MESTALQFVPFLKQKFPHYLEEIEAVASGSGNSTAAILALNVRTEITYGLMKDDGCTTIAWKTKNESFLAQNWDWQVEQKENLVVLSVAGREGKPNIKMVTEAGIIGKIGLNDAGVGVCLNAIAARGMSVERLPVHLGLRLCLDSNSKEEAVKRIKEAGIGAACTITVADGNGAVALECSSTGIQEIEMDGTGRVFHSNHYLKEQVGVRDSILPKDTLNRVKRIEELADGIAVEDVSVESITRLFEDEEGIPGAICRIQGDGSKAATIFNIVSDLSAKKAQVILGRPTEPEEKFWLDFTPN